MRYAIATLLVGSLLAAQAGGQATDPPSTAGTGEAWQIIQPPQSTLVLARDSSLIGEIGKEWRTSVSIRTLPTYVPQAFIAVEDQRFYQHDGVDVVGIAGALKDALSGHARGASTITQQLVGNMHPDVVNRADRSISRKLREQSAAREMERHYSKEQILEAYLNQIHFGHGWWGIDAAARHYFGKPAASLTLAEAATLAALPKGPALYDPIRHPDRARERRNLVLSLMEEQGYISPATAAAAKRTPVLTAPDMGMPVAAPWVADAAARQAERAGVSLTAGGLTVYTTIDAELQRDATEALAAGTARVEKLPGYAHPTLANHAKGRTDFLEGMVVALDAGSGDILAMVGGRDYLLSPFNRVTGALRQPGSAFKPFVYAMAIEDSITTATVVYDTALAIPLDRTAVYRPVNADSAFLGAMTVREALVRSRNPVAVQLGMRVGIDSVAALAHRLGIEAPISPYPSSAIGASVVNPLDLVSAYGAFATLGSVAEPRLISHIDDRAGRTVFATVPQVADSVLSAPVAFIVRDLMRDVVARGTGVAVRRSVPDRVPVAGKTGTTNDNSDVWFVGATPEIVAGVWLGFDTPTPIARGAAGGSLAAPIWGDMIGGYYQARQSGSWDEVPAGVVAVPFDRATGKPADSSTLTDQGYTEYFLAGTEPGFVDPWSFFAAGPIDR